MIPSGRYSDSPAMRIAVSRFWRISSRMERCGRIPTPAFCDKLQVRYNLESYFVPEGEGRKLEDARNAGKVTVVAAVTPSGRAAVKRLLLDGKPVYDEPWF